MTVIYNLLIELEFVPTLTMDLFCDYEVAIDVAHNINVHMIVRRMLKWIGTLSRKKQKKQPWKF